MARSLDDIQRIVDALDYDFDSFSLDHFIDHIQRLRNRKIIVIGWKFVPELYALWVLAPSVDYVTFNNTLHPIHQTHAVLHELAHMILGHACMPLDQILSPEMLAELNFGTSQGCSRTVLPNETHPDQEKEAEDFVCLIQTQVVTAQRMNELYKGSSTVAVFKPYADGMGFEE